MKLRLLCTFVHAENLNFALDYIYRYYQLSTNSIYVFKNVENSKELFCTYNISGDRQLRFAENTILVHRKKDTNSIYTINAMNDLIRRINNGVLDTSISLDWELYSNMLLYTKDGHLRKVELELKRVSRPK